MKLRCIIWCAVSTKAQIDEDKFSLPEQERNGVEIAEKEGWEIVDILRVPGHSRRYIDFHDLVADAEKRGIDAFTRLLRHWEKKDFDILIVTDGDRFARTQSLNAYVVERTLIINARIYSYDDGFGWVDDTNFRMFISMIGYKSAAAVDKLVKSRNKAMSGRASRGLPVSSTLPMSHKLLRDDMGKAKKLELRSELMPLWNDLAELILEGVSWHKLEDELFTRFGHVNPEPKTNKKNKPSPKPNTKYYSGYFYKQLMNPIFWGHTARHHRGGNGPNGYRNLECIFDETIPVPKGVEFYRNTHESVYKGDLAQSVKAEILRRITTVKGNADPANTHKFSGLGICAVCGKSWSTYVNGNYVGVRCQSRYRSQTVDKHCDNHKILNEKTLIALVDRYFRQFLELQPIGQLLDEPDTGTKVLKDRIKNLEQHMEDCERQIRSLIKEQSKVSDDMKVFYRGEIEQFIINLKNMRSTYSELTIKLSESELVERPQSLSDEQIIALSVEAFWQQDNRSINQQLKRLMGKKRFILWDGEIIGVSHSEKPHRYPA